MSLTPEVTWAQRSSDSDAERNYVFVTLMTPDVSKDKTKLDVKADRVTFEGYSNSKKATYAVELVLFAEIDPSATKISHTDRSIELVLRKKDLKQEFWPRLLKDSKKMHFLKTDFDKWVDEDEQDVAGEDEDYMSKMNAMGGDGGFGGIDFSKLGGGAGGMPDLGDLGAAGKD
ncbi:HSP20-like chaperone [Pseudovirgaria hyperparasitica]|uniref:HSP20-like chaperone n=1 Tax=Pseudovirgaria hyperparasitica TaxID=470096 RepID=A0A6A6WIP9_9PEZI|nr:HSP20-like chaperone [Pseudovirgaria hyperparasitica]KAF2762004.1 HSP20-like chaperone [Pseudovirgaria hyperparasitica]